VGNANRAKPRPGPPPLIDLQYLTRSYYGSRRMAAWLATHGHFVNRQKVQRLMRLISDHPGLIIRRRLIELLCAWREEVTQPGRNWCMPRVPAAFHGRGFRPAAVASAGRSESMPHWRRAAPSLARAPSGRPRPCQEGPVTAPSRPQRRAAGASMRRRRSTDRSWRCP
jgi:HTH-like domain